MKQFTKACFLGFPSPVLMKARIGDIVWQRRTELKKSKSKPEMDSDLKRPKIDTTV